MYASLLKLPGDLFADLDQVQRQFDDLFAPRGWPASIRALGRGAFPAINMGSSTDAVEIYAFAPGVDPATLDVTVDRGLLTIAGERASRTPTASDKLNVYARERYSGPFKRVVALPDDVDPTRVSASYRNGVLRIAVPKLEASKPRRIAVQGVQ